MATLSELIAQKTALEKEIDSTRQRDVGKAIAQILALVGEYKLTASDIFAPGKSKSKLKADSKNSPKEKKEKKEKIEKKPTTKVAPKYKDPETGATWTGRGISPKWLAGKNKADFLITV
jgi:DNA-binding protein H-NS